MRKFLLHITLFAAATLGVFLVIDILASMGLRRTPKNHLETFNTIMNDTLNNDVLILGNSRASCGYDPYCLDSVLGCNSRNIGVSGQAFGIAELRYRIYRRHNPAPKLLIVNIDAGQLGAGALGYEREQYYPYITDTILHETLIQNGLTWWDLHIPLYRYRGNYKYVGLGLCNTFGIYHLKGWGYKGYFPHPAGEWHGQELQNQLTIHGKIPCGMDSAVVQLMDNFLYNAKQEGIQTVLVYAPIYYLLEENFAPAYDTIMATYQAFSRKYDVPILDYHGTPMCYDTTYFYDSNHVNSLGATIFTIRLAQDIDSLCIANSFTQQNQDK